MILIEKGPEPKMLARAKGLLHATPNVEYCYDNLPPVSVMGEPGVHAAIIEGLLKEQGGLCAYCMRRIGDRNSSNPAHVEHWAPRSKSNGASSLDYAKMLAVCDGGSNSKPKDQTCDTRRRNHDLTIDPQNSRHIQTLSYGRDGRLISSDAVLQSDINVTLNLNGASTLLPRNRKAVLEETERTIRALYKKAGGKNAKTKIKKMVEKLESPQNERCEFAGVVIWRLKKHLR